MLCGCSGLGEWRRKEVVINAMVLLGLQASWPLLLTCLALAGKSCNGSPKWMQTLGGGPWSCHSKEGNIQPKPVTREVGAVRERVSGIPQRVQTEASAPVMFLNEMPKQVETRERPSIHQLRHRKAGALSPLGVEA